MTCRDCTRKGGCVYTTFWLVRFLPVVLVTIATGWGIYAYTYELCILSIDNWPQRIIYLIVFYSLLVLYYTSYLRTIYTPAWKPPQKFFLEGAAKTTYESVRDDERQLQAFLTDIVRERDLTILVRGFDHGIRFCDKCCCIKPDRSHHCSMCEQCVLKFDHHCPWVNNCVNFGNYKYFILFLAMLTQAPCRSSFPTTSSPPQLPTCPPPPAAEFKLDFWSIVLAILEEICNGRIGSSDVVAVFLLVSVLTGAKSHFQALKWVVVRLLKTDLGKRFLTWMNQKVSGSDEGKEKTKKNGRNEVHEGKETCQDEKKAPREAASVGEESEKEEKKIGRGGGSSGCQDEVVKACVDYIVTRRDETNRGNNII